MFTGIIQKIGTVDRVFKDKRGISEMIVRVNGNWDNLELGESIAFNGVCLSISAFDDDSLHVELSPETLKKTGFSHDKNQRVNLERSVCMGDRLGGHLVQGHVDGMADVSKIIRRNDRHDIIFTYPEPLKPYFIEKGSVAINGVSLTIFDITDASFTVAIIPLTLEKTNLSDLKPGDRCHLETDMMGRFLHRFYVLRKKK